MSVAWTNHDVAVIEVPRLRARSLPLATGIGVAWGYHPTDRMLSAGACAVAHSSLALQKMVDDWLDGSSFDEAAEAAAFFQGVRAFQYA